MTDYRKIKATTQQIVKLPVEADYDGIEYLTDGCRLKAEDISEAISENGESLIMPPETAFDNLDFKIEGKNPSQWSVNINLWTIEEGQSDLTLELTLIDNEKKILEAEVDNIHTL